MKPAGWRLIDDDAAADRAAASVVEASLESYNHAVSPLADVRALACYARNDEAAVIGGLIGRTWGTCAELQQLWVYDAWRGQGLGTALLGRFEAMAAARGCRLGYLYTFSFQAPEFYRRFGWTAVHTIEGYAPGIAKYAMEKRLVSPG